MVGTNFLAGCNAVTQKPQEGIPQCDHGCRKLGFRPRLRFQVITIGRERFTNSR